jgi:lipopolysaccharide export system permease protein
MLFQSSIRRELARSFGATFVVLLTIVLTIVLIRTLGQASRGSVNPQDVVLFMAYAALGKLPTILTLSLFISLVSTLSRMYRDSELVIWLSSGQSLSSFLKPMFRFAWPILVITFLTSMFVWPWTNQQTKIMQETYGSRSDIDRIAPGQFQESSSGNRVFFIDREGKPESNSSSNIFIATNEKGKSSVTTANAGRIETRDATRYILLENGQRLEAENGKPANKISVFEEYGSKAGGAAAPATDAKDPQLMSVATLLAPATSTTLAELAWRLGLVLCGVNLVVLAISLTRINPRSGRNLSLVFVVLIFIAYNNLINLGRSWIFSGQIGFTTLLVVLHGGVLLAALLWLAKRDNHWRFGSAIQRRPLPAMEHI